MPFVELTRILPESKKVKWLVNPNNIIYVQEPLPGDSQGGCMIVDVSGKDTSVADAYQDVIRKLDTA
jgi:hypothetical protein